MENWGLVTYRETALLIAPTNAETQYQSVCSINAHELAHQWFDILFVSFYHNLLIENISPVFYRFGDLVTTNW